eukprot:4380190-Alexandrium_andersonii.AAC.1
MSASLVGSEMCIRDSCRATAARRCSALRVCACWGAPGYGAGARPDTVHTRAAAPACPRQPPPQPRQDWPW